MYNRRLSSQTSKRIAVPKRSKGNPTWSATCWGSVVGKQHNFGRLSLNLTSMIVTHLSHHYCCPAFINSRHIAIFSQSPKKISMRNMIKWYYTYHWNVSLEITYHFSRTLLIPANSQQPFIAPGWLRDLFFSGWIPWLLQLLQRIHCFIHWVTPQEICHFQTGVLLFYLHPISIPYYMMSIYNIYYMVSHIIYILIK